MFTTIRAALELIALVVIAVAAGTYIWKHWPWGRHAEGSADGPAGEREPVVEVEQPDELPNYCQQVVPMVRPERWRLSENFTEAGRRVVSGAFLQAYAHHSDHVGTEHLLMALIENCPDQLTEWLRGSEVTAEDVRRRVEAEIGPEQTPRAAHLPYSPHVKRALGVSVGEAQQQGGELIDVDHIMRGLFSQPDSAAVRFVSDLGVDPGKIVRRPTHWSGVRRDRSVS